MLLRNLASREFGGSNAEQIFARCNTFRKRYSCDNITDFCLNIVNCGLNLLDCVEVIDRGCLGQFEELLAWCVQGPGDTDMKGRGKVLYIFIE